MFFILKPGGLRVGVRALLASKGFHNVDESPVVLDPPLGASGLFLLLFSGFDLGSLTTDLTGTSKRSVHLSSEESDGHVNGETIELGNLEAILKRGAGAVQVDVLERQRLLESNCTPDVGYGLVLNEVEDVA